MITVMVEDLMRQTALNLARSGVRCLADVRALANPLVGFSPEIEQHQRELRAFLHESFYSHYKVARMRHRARIIITGLFHAYARGPRMLPPRFQALALEDGRSRAISDYIAGMTDGYAQKEHALLFQGGEGLLDP
jgi:dGTPase